MTVLALHAFVLVVVMFMLVLAGCTASSPNYSAGPAPERLEIDRIYDSPNGPDLYRIKTSQGTTYHRQHYRSPLRDDVACKDVRP